MSPPPYIPQDVQEIASVLKALELARKERRRGAFSIKKTTFNVGASRNGITVDSWRMQDWDYKRHDLPTYARGLFTTKTQQKDSEIAVRGYDKFFNVGEVKETKWENIFAQTQPPYELTLKENGCIIFVAGLEDETLLVCSKHSTGDRSDVQVSHAMAAELRLEQQLASIGKTKTDLARELRQRNATAVAELCDDAFEEHILAYTPDNAGLYLHGINLNLPKFATYPSTDVQEFADMWGFKKTSLIVMEDIQKVKTFLDEVAESGAHDGRDVEGFVVRCKMSPNPSTAPYEDWFFKYKFEEPYLMYRQWRECTKALIAGKVPKFKKHTNITDQYLVYARQRLAADPKLGKLYNENHGIIALRNDFLNFRNLKGADAANLDSVDPLVLSDVTKDVVLCPIATIGCGKTTIALTLSVLFGWGHIQNDNLSGRGRPPRFTKAVMDELKQHPVVFADRNNAQRHERRQIITDMKLRNSNVKIVCLNFRHDDGAIHEIRRITQERVLERGDNHQTIHAATDKDKFISVMEGFIDRFEPCNPHARPDHGFDVVIDLDPTAGSRKNLETTIAELKRVFPNLISHEPTPEQLDSALETTLRYKPDFRHDIPDRGQKQREQTKPKASSNKKKQLEYMSIDVPSATVNALLDKAFQACDKQTSRFYLQLKQTRRIQLKFHVTLMHRAMSKQKPELWQWYKTLHEAAGGGDATFDDCELMLERVVFDSRLMAIVVRLIDPEGKWPCANEVAHITVGTRDDAVKPKESNDLLGKWLEIGVDGNDSIGTVVFVDKPTIRGAVKGVMSR